MDFQTLFSTPFFSIEETNEIIQETGFPYYRITGADSVICCVMTFKGEVILVRQYRHSIEETTLEMPAGGLNDSETPLEAAKREFKEETGFDCKFIYLGDFSLMMNRTNIKEHIFFGFDPSKNTHYEVEDGLSVELIDRERLLKLAVSGDYRQLAGLGVLQITSAILQLDIFTAPLDQIQKKFNQRLMNK